MTLRSYSTGQEPAPSEAQVTLHMDRVRLAECALVGMVSVGQAGYFHLPSLRWSQGGQVGLRDQHYPSQWLSPGAPSSKVWQCPETCLVVVTGEGHQGFWKLVCIG